jgi:small subunit ribosomal protein S6
MQERLYDLIFICRPDTPEPEIEKLIATLQHAAEEKQAKVEKVEKWGTRRLAYRVKRLREGFFVYMLLRSSHGELLKELERRLRVSDAVVKYLTIRLDEEIKRQQKFTKRRERRAARRPRKTAAAPATPGAAAPAPEQAAARG